jgi:hypothetical protein
MGFQGQPEPIAAGDNVVREMAARAFHDVGLEAFGHTEGRAGATPGIGGKTEAGRR